MTKENKTLKEFDLLKEYKNMILTGAPGTGKTYLARKEIAIEIIEIAKITGNKEENIAFVQFHPSYDYTDFVEGLRPNGGANGFERQDGIFKTFCKKAIEKPNENFVFIIDEINRGEVSRIFGELFFSLEPDYRGENGRVNTQYQNLITDPNDEFFKGFYIPKNVYIIGTMNDIDRSVESFDFAFRRRFAWKEITAKKSFENMGLSGDLVNRVSNLNTYIDGTLGGNYQIGGAYILKYIDKKTNQLKENAKDGLWNYSLKPLLESYICGNKNLELSNFENIFFNNKNIIIDKKNDDDFLFNKDVENINILDDKYQDFDWLKEFAGKNSDNYIYRYNLISAKIDNEDPIKLENHKDLIIKIISNLYKKKTQSF